MYFRQLLNDETACASYLLGCETHGAFAVIDPRVALVDEHIGLADGQGAAIVEVLDTHLQGRPPLRPARARRSYRGQRVPARGGGRRLRALRVERLGEGHARQRAHHGRRQTGPRARPPRPPGRRPLARQGAVADAHRDALLVGDAGRPDLHAHGEHAGGGMARILYRSLTERLLPLPDHLVLYPSHYSGSVRGHGLSSNPVATIGFERRHSRALQLGSEDALCRR